MTKALTEKSEKQRDNTKTQQKLRLHNDCGPTLDGQLGYQIQTKDTKVQSHKNIYENFIGNMNNKYIISHYIHKSTLSPAPLEANPCLRTLRLTIKGDDDRDIGVYEEAQYS